ncbi:CAP-Gly domain-containing protein [Elsinoe australis]|uniref:CAP-Gly domain-containing protein n=1 Tax=Elsinoe australis TaxID=40998 RepID=A0A4U7BAP5_9PEZI|nr:CAP-Gly domain-containing protein [Elsinoe australis]
MATHTPLRRASARPSMGANSSPNLLERASTSMHRKASYNALTGGPPTTPSSKLTGSANEFVVGDVVNVPGDMHGTIKFIGSVNGKAGRFLGVELSREFAARGKNSGDVEGVNYFNTTVPGSGIFLPVHRAQLRFSPSTSSPGQDEDSPSTTPTASTYRARTKPGISPTTPSVPKFAQTVGPGARPPSPSFKPKPRQSLPRPESPLRRQPPTLTPGPGRQFSQSVRPGSKPPTTPSSRAPTPKLSASVRGGAPPTRPYSRTGSRLGQRNDSLSESSDAGRGVPSFSHPMRSPSRLNRGADEAAELREELARKDRQLEEQAVQLAEMEVSLKEIQALLPDDSSERGKGSEDGEGDGDTRELKGQLREKSEKINSLVSEFDAHRADFRSTIETLELASDETVRMYEERIKELVSEVQDLRENSTAQQDVETIAAQLKMLEELVAELEDGLEDARRGEAEARGEVEFLRGEVERGRSELKREREKAAQLSGSVDGDDRTAELEMKDDEIRGLKAILHSVQSNAGDDMDEEMIRKNSSVYSVDMEEMKRLQTSLHELEVQNAELEAQLRREQEEKNNLLSPSMASKKSMGGISDASREPSQLGSRKPSRVEHEVRCEGCDKPGHDLLNCPSFSMPNGGLKHEQPARNGSAVSPMTAAVSPLPEADKAAAGNGDDDKWCALCEQDGHLAFDCPNEQY